MKRILLLFIPLLIVAACTSEASDNPASAGDVRAQQGAEVGEAPDAFDDSDCNFKTVLDPKKAGSPGNLIPSPRNPNGDSELAVLMRLFIDDLREARLLLEAGAKADKSLAKMWPTHRLMRCAWPTKPSDRDESFDGRAQSYLMTVRAFDEAPSKDSYNAIVTSCVACHQVSCAGVIDFIESLRWQ